MKDALNQQIQVGDYVAYANRHGMMIVRVSRIEEYTDPWGESVKIRIVGKYALKVHHSAGVNGWIPMNNGYVRPLTLPENAIKLPREMISDSLVELLA